MKKQTAKRLEIFLLLALRQAARRSFPDVDNNSEIEEARGARTETDDAENSPEIDSVFPEQLAAPDAEKFERLRLNYQSKSEIEKQKWRERVANSIGADEFAIDEVVHRSHVEAALQKEAQAIQKILAPALPFAHENQSAAIGVEADDNRKSNDLTDASPASSARLEKIVRQTFAAQFVALRDLPAAVVFDRLSGAQLARLVRLAGLREVAYACAGIKAVEAVSGFLRRFAPEDGRAVAAQLSGLPKISEERLAFAESLVQSALEIETEPSAQMLDWLGIRLVGILLCAPASSAARLAYAEQKLPFETGLKLSEIIETECRATPPELKKKIAAEIERLAETVGSASGKNE